MQDANLTFDETLKRYQPERWAARQAAYEDEELCKKLKSIEQWNAIQENARREAREKKASLEETAQPRRLCPALEDHNRRWGLAGFDPPGAPDHFDNDRLYKSNARRRPSGEFRRLIDPDTVEPQAVSHLSLYQGYLAGSGICTERSSSHVPISNTDDYTQPTVATAKSSPFPPNTLSAEGSLPMTSHTETVYKRVMSILFPSPNCDGDTSAW
jgi:hypothetical protein